MRFTRNKSSEPKHHIFFPGNNDLKMGLLASATQKQAEKDFGVDKVMGMGLGLGPQGFASGRPANGEGPWREASWGASSQKKTLGGFPGAWGLSSMDTYPTARERPWGRVG